MNILRTAYYPAGSYRGYRLLMYCIHKRRGARVTHESHCDGVFYVSFFAGFLGVSSAVLSLEEISCLSRLFASLRVGCGVAPPCYLQGFGVLRFRRCCELVGLTIVLGVDHLASSVYFGGVLSRRWVATLIDGSDV